MSRRWQPPSVSFFAFQDIITSIVGIFVLIVLCMVLELVDKVEGKSTTSSTVVAQQSVDKLQSEVESLQIEYEKLRESVLATAQNNNLNRDQRILQFDQSSANTVRQIEILENMLTATLESVSAAKKVQEGLAKKYQAAGAKREELKKLGEESEMLEVQIAKIETEDMLIFRDTTTEGRHLVLVEIQPTGIRLSDSLTGAIINFQGLSKLTKLGDWLRAENMAPRQFLILLRPGGLRDFEAILKLMEEESIAHGFDVIGSKKSIHLESQVRSM